MAQPIRDGVILRSGGALVRRDDGCGVRLSPDVLERARDLIGEASTATSPDAFRAVVTDGVVRCMPEVTATFSNRAPTEDVRATHVDFDAPTADRLALVVSSERGFLCPHERDLVSLLAPHLRDAHRGACVRALLPPRQREVLRLIGTGLTNRRVARNLSISPETVRAHLEQTYSRLGVGTRTAAIAAAG